MAEGQEQIDKALKLVHELADGSKGCSEEVCQRLKKVISILEGLSGKLFLKTKAATPHVSAILKATEELKNSEPGDEFNDTLDHLESETEILRLKVANRDIVIT